MSPVSRRILIYWLLLLIPTLVVGCGAVLLLREEQAKIDKQQTYAGEARRAAAAGRSGLIVENIELLVSDVQDGLLETLATFNTGSIDQDLQAWEQASPLVRTAFRCAPNGTILLPAESATDEDGRGFRRRFAERFQSSPPWRTDVESDTAQKKEDSVQPFAEGKLRSALNRDEREAREQATQNVAQVQSARRDAQYDSKVRSSAARVASGDMSALAAAPTAGPAAPMSAREQSGSFGGLTLSALADRPSDRRGWTPWLADGRLHLLGWIERGREVRGVEVEVSALISRLGAALPAEPATGEGYALRDGRGRVMHQVGWVPRDPGAPPAVSLPVAAEALPGWEVVAFLDAPALATSSNGFLFLGSVLVAILLVAILAGGSLLFWQARRSEAEAAQKTSFVANVSHEFKTPLTTIRLYSELLEQGRVADAAKRGEYLRTIGRETQRLARLVGNALDFSRLEQGRKKYASEPLELRAELSRLLDTHAPRFAEAGIRIERILPDESIVVTTDRDAVEQILLNLLDNAVKYAATGGEVLVELTGSVSGGASIRVLDRGPGVPAAHCERIFDKFHRVDDTLTAEKTGAGLGLSIARQLARGLGGDLRYESRPGGGSAFIFELK